MAGEFAHTRHSRNKINTIYAVVASVCRATCRICRNELLDQTLFWTESDLQAKLALFQQYFNVHRTHMGLDGAIPNDLANNHDPKIIDIKNYRWKSHCRGLFQLPMAA